MILATFTFLPNNNLVWTIVNSNNLGKSKHILISKLNILKNFSLQKKFLSISLIFRNKPYFDR